MENKQITLEQSPIVTQLAPQHRKMWRPRVCVPQLSLPPSLIEPVTVKKLNSTQRRAARLAAGKLVIIDGKLIGVHTATGI